MTKSLDAMAAEVRNVNEDKGWRRDERTFGELIALLHSEVSEALEEVRNGRRPDETYYSFKTVPGTSPHPTMTYDGQIYVSIKSFHTGSGEGPPGREWVPLVPDNAFQHGYSVKPEGVPVELADVFIRLLDMCDRYGIDLEQAYELKMAHNRTRPFRHGGKTL